MTDSGDIDAKSDAVRGFSSAPSGRTSVTYGPYRPERTTISVSAGRIDPERPAVRLGEKLAHLLRRQLVGREVGRQARALLTALEVRAVAPDAHHGVGAGDLDRVHRPRVDLVEVIGDEVMEAGVAPVPEVEPRQPLDACLLAGGDAVEVVLHTRGEVEVDELLEVALEEVDHRERREGRDERGALLEDVAAVDDRREDRGVRRRAADAALLESSDEASAPCSAREGRSRARPARASGA